MLSVFISRSRRVSSNLFLGNHISVDTAENEPFEIWRSPASYVRPYLYLGEQAARGGRGGPRTVAAVATSLQDELPPSAGLEALTR